MSTGAFNLILQITGIVMITYHYFHYNNLGKGKITFPLYFYVAIFPYITISPFYDAIAKIVLLYGVLTLFMAKQKLKINKFEILFLSIVIITSLINIYNINIDLFLTNFINLLFMLLFSFYAFNTIKSSEQMKQVLSLFIVNSFVLGIIGIIEFFLVGNTRPEVAFGNPNYYGLYLYISIICLFLLNNKKSKITILYAVIIGFACFLTGSHTLYLFLIVQVVFWVISFFNTRIVYKLFIWTFALIVMFYMYSTIFLSNISTGLLSYFVKEDDVTRIYIWRYAWEMFTNNVIEGVGYGNLRIPYGPINFVTHNDYLRVLGETGIIGFGILITYFILLFFKLIKFDRKTVFYLGTFQFAMLIFSLTHNNLNSILFWFFISLPLYSNSLNFRKK